MTRNPRLGHDQDLDVRGRKVACYVTSRAEPTRAVVVLHESFGLNDDMRRIADRFAGEGYLAVVPDLLSGRGPMPVCVYRCMKELAKGGGEVLDDIEAVRKWVVDRGGIAEDAIGVAGFCLGGGFAVLAAGRGRFRVSAPFYGDVPKSARKLPNLCPTVASFGGRDTAFGGGARLLKKHLEEAGVPHDVKTYPDAGHSFMSEYPAWLGPARFVPPMYAGGHADSASDAWSRMLRFFHEHLHDVTTS